MIMVSPGQCVVAVRLTQPIADAALDALIRITELMAIRSTVAIGKRPQDDELARSALRARRGPRLTLGSSTWPSKSTKKTYSGFAGLGGERLDPGQVELVLLEDVEGLDQRARAGAATWNMTAVLSLPVLAALLMADDGEARLVVRIVLDVGEEDAQAVPDGGLPAGDGGGARLAAGPARRPTAVLDTSCRSACGTFLLSQLRHCDRACGLL